MKLLKNASRVAILCFFLLCVNGCKEEKDDSPLPYNPNLPVTISDFTPHNGGAKTRMIIYGSNFGTDPSIISLKIGGKETKVINAKGDCLYCITPSMCFEGSIEIKVGDSEPVMAPTKFEYEKKRTVSTLCGYVDQLGKFEVKAEGSFDDKSWGLDCPAWLSFDPKEPDIIYCVQDLEGGDQANKPLLKFDLKERYMSTALRLGQDGVNRLRTISWTPQADTMVLASAKGDDKAASNIMLKRSENFSIMERLTTSKGCQSSVVHPENGELYYSRFADGTVWRYDFNQWGANQNNLYAEQLFAIQDTQWEFNFVQHPSGDYMYIIVVNKHYIMRSNYDRETKRYTMPYIVCGGVNQAGYADLVGTKARLNSPRQGVFVKNPDYAGKSDEYDFYFVDANNHCVRILTPNGVVSTFAGRGSTGINADAWGYIDGDLRNEARFNLPCGIAYDERTETFYISDKKNHRIRKISYEFTDDTEEPTEPDGDGGEGEDGDDSDNGEGEDGSTDNTPENSNK